MKILIAGANVSERMGGEAILPFRYFVGLRRRRLDAFLVTHARCRNELERSLAPDGDRIFYIEDHVVEILLHKTSLLFPHPLREVLFFPLVHAVTEYRLGRLARRIAYALNVDILHQPTPVSPRAPSFLYSQPSPVVIGPMNGNIDYPVAFRRDYAKGTRIITRASRLSSGVLNQLFPGKTEAARLLAANERTACALKSIFPRSEIELLVENGVDLKEWPREMLASWPRVAKFLFVGRLVHWKAVDILIDAFNRLRGPAELLIIGDGPDRDKLKEQARGVETVQKKIRFLGCLDHAGVRREMTNALALVLPSLRESGGAVILEAMASCLPVIATKWLGPEDYVSKETGFLVEPLDRAYMVRQIAEHMENLVRNPKMAQEMGQRGRTTIEKRFSWDAKIDQILNIYRNSIGV